MITARLTVGRHLGWISAAALILGLPATSWIYWPSVGRAGALPPYADTIIIAMMGSLILAVVLLPIVCGVTWLCLRDSRLPIRVLEWDRARPTRSATVSLLFALPTALVLWSLLNTLIAPTGWYDLLWLPHTLVTLSWLALMRGSALSSDKASRLREADGVAAIREEFSPHDDEWCAG